MPSKPLRFHWSFSAVGDKLRAAKGRHASPVVPDVDALTRFAQHAESCGIESLLTAFGFHRPDPLVLAASVGARTSRIKFMVAVRSGVCSPTLFVQQVNSVAAMTAGRICLNVVAGHTPEEQKYYGDFLDHDQRYQRTDEFLTICHALWRRDGELDFAGRHYQVEKAKLNLPFVSPTETRPEIYVGGSSDTAAQLAIKHGDCLWLLADGVDTVAQRSAPVISSGTEVGVLVSLLIRRTREEARAAADAMISELGDAPRRTHQEFARRSDSVAFLSTYALAKNADWKDRCLWTGAVPYMGAPSIALVGSAEEVAGSLLDYQEAGITQFLFIGWPDFEEMTNFSQHVLPLVRQKEAEMAAESIPATIRA